MEKSAKLKQLKIDAEKIIEEAGRYNVEWYNKAVNSSLYMGFYKYLDDNYAKEIPLENLTDEELEDYIFQEGFSKFSHKKDVVENLRSIAKDLADYNLSWQKIRAENLSRLKVGGESDSVLRTVALEYEGNRNRDINAMKNKSIHYCSYKDAEDALRDCKRGLHDAYLESKHHSRLVSDFLGGIRGNPESSPQISWALLMVAVIFFVGVIYPLSFLPAAGIPVLGISWEIVINNIFSIKGGLLAAVSIAFTVVVVVFSRSNLSMKYSVEKVDELEGLVKPVSYCEYFVFFE